MGSAQSFRIVLITISADEVINLLPDLTYLLQHYCLHSLIVFSELKQYEVSLNI